MFGGIAIILVASLVSPDGVISKRKLVAFGVVAAFFCGALVFGRRGNIRLFAIFATLVIAAEIMLRIAGTFEKTRPDLDWFPWVHPQPWQARPYFMFSGPIEGMADVPANMGGSDSERIATFNRDGFRIDGEVVKPKPANEVRIFVLGGSAAVMGAPLSKTIPGVIETHLRSSGLEQVRVYNFGVVGFVSGQQLSLLVHHLVALEPDLIIAYDGRNDLFVPWVYDPRPGYPFNFLDWESAIAPISRSSTRTIADSVEDSAIGRFLFDPKGQQRRAALRALRAQVGFGTTDWKQKIVEVYAANIAATCRFSRNNGILFAEFFQPTLHYYGNLNPGQAELAGGEQLVQGMMDQRAGVLATFANGIPPHDPGCRFSDLSGFFEKQGSEYFWDVVHIDNRGNEVIGKTIAEELLVWDAFRNRVDRAR